MKIDVRINNAGTMGIKEYTLTLEGLESQFGPNRFGHFLLTNLPMPRIEAASKGTRIVNVSSNGSLVSNIRFKDYNFDNGKAYNPWKAYGQSKTANILFTVSLAAKHAPKGITSFDIHPGVIFTNFGAYVKMSEWGVLGEMLKERGYSFTPGPKHIA